MKRIPSLSGHLVWLVLAFALLAAGPVQAQELGPASFSCSSVAEIPQIECEALVALYNSTNGPGWTANTDWLHTTTPCVGAG